MRRPALLGLSLLALGLTLGAGTVLWQALQLATVADVAAAVEAWKPAASLARLGLIALLAVLWPRLVARGARAGLLTVRQAALLQAHRWRLVLWLLAFELVLGQGALITVIRGLAATAP